MRCLDVVREVGAREDEVFGESAVATPDETERGRRYTHT